MNFEKFKFKKDYDFLFYSIFFSIIVFIIFMFIYPNVLINLIFSVLVYFFLRISRFFWNIIKNLLGFFNGKGY